MLTPPTRPDCFKALVAVHLQANFAQDGALQAALEAIVAAMLDNFGLHDYADTNRASAKRTLGMLGRTTCRAALAKTRIETESHK